MLSSIPNADGKSRAVGGDRLNIVNRSSIFQIAIEG